MSKRSYRNAPTEHTNFYPRLIGRKGAVASNSYLSANAGADLLRAGGNAIDAACAATLVEGLVNPHMNGIGGECPMLIRAAGSNEVVSVNGNTEAPMGATVEAYRARGLKDVPDIGVLAAGAPATPSALLAVLARFGTKSFAEVAAPAIELAKNGHPAQTGLVHQQNYGLRDTQARLREWPGSWALYYPGGKPPEVGQLLKNPALAKTYEAMAAGERSASGDRAARLQGARDVFYKGEIADEIARFVKEQDGFLAKADLERYQTRFEKPASMKIADTEVFKCGIWSQGPAVIQTLAIMQNWDVKALGHGSADYCHLLVEAMKLAFADREQFYADPDAVPVPVETLLSAEYGRKRAALIDMRHASTEHRPGDAFKGGALLDPSQHLLPAPWGRGTVHVDAVDAQGNMASFTPSGAWIPSSPVIPALGFPLGNRLMTFYLAPANHPNLLAPGKRPAHHAHAGPGLQGRQALDELRHHGRRPAGAVADPVLHQPRDLRHGRAAGHRGAQAVHRAHARLLRPAQLLPQPPARRTAHRQGRARRTGAARPRSGHRPGLDRGLHHRHRVEPGQRPIGSRRRPARRQGGGVSAVGLRLVIRRRSVSLSIHELTEKPRQYWGFRSNS
jgi:gamma-glutamyltranspeptidase/glutathione hydrolase